MPKLAGEHVGLVSLLEYTSGIDALSQYPSWHQMETGGKDLLDLLALLLVDACERLVRGGLLSDYREVEDALPVLRGRLLADRQLLRRFGQIQRLECRFDERVTDIPENQLLAAALDLLATRVHSPAVALRIRRLRTLFAAVCSPAALNLAAARHEISYHRMNEPYREPHQLAWLILDGLAVKDLLAPGDTRCFAFLLDMNTLFERFVEEWVTALLRNTPLRARRQARTASVLWDADRNKSYSNVIPDIVVRRRYDQGQAFPIDAKYKLYDERSIASSDIYQSFVYAFAMSGTPAAGMLVFPTASSSPCVLTLHVRDLAGRQGAEIWAFGVNIPRALKEARRGAGAFGERLLELISRRFASSNESE